MNGEYRSPGPATRRAVPTENLKTRTASHLRDLGTTSSGWDALELDAGTTPGIFSYFLETPTPEFGLSDGRLDATV
jgi:hypothetical protein